jgi:hypothetical protein
MPRLPGRLDRDWPRVPGAPAQTTKSVPTVPRGPSEAQPGNVPASFQKELRHVGIIVSPERMTDPEKLNTLREWSTAEKQGRNKEFPGSIHLLETIYPRRRGHCEAADETHGEKQVFQCTPEVDAAFQSLKGALYTAPIPVYPQPGGKLIVDTDASYIGIGGVLSGV